MLMQGPLLERSRLGLDWVAVATPRTIYVRVDHSTIDARVGAANPTTARVIEDPNV